MSRIEPLLADLIRTSHDLAAISETDPSPANLAEVRRLARIVLENADLIEAVGGGQVVPFHP